MFKALFSNLFKIKFDRTSGICREVTKKKIYFLYFTEKDKERLENLCMLQEQFPICTLQKLYCH